jgi:hypothetical protein
MGLQRLDVLNGQVSEILPLGDLITLNKLHHRIVILDFGQGWRRALN